MRDNYMMNYPLGLVPTGEMVEAKREGIYEPLKPKPLRGPHVGFRDNVVRIDFNFQWCGTSVIQGSGYPKGFNLSRDQAHTLYEAMVCGFHLNHSEVLNYLLLLCRAEVDLDKNRVRYIRQLQKTRSQNSVFVEGHSFHDVEGTFGDYNIQGSYRILAKAEHVLIVNTVYVYGHLRLCAESVEQVAGWYGYGPLGSFCAIAESDAVPLCALLDKWLKKNPIGCPSSVFPDTVSLSSDPDDEEEEGEEEGEEEEEEEEEEDDGDYEDEYEDEYEEEPVAANPPYLKGGHSSDGIHSCSKAIRDWTDSVAVSLETTKFTEPKITRS